MLVVMKAQATEEQIRAVCQKIEELGYRAHPMPGAQRTAIGITGNRGEVEPGTLDEMPGVQELIRVSKPYKLVSRDVKPENTVITFPGTDATFGGPGMLSLPDLVPSRAANRPWQWRSKYAARERNFFAEALTSRALRPTRSRAWAKQACRSWPKCGTNSA